MSGTGKRSLPPEQNARLQRALVDLYGELGSDQAVADALARVTGEKAPNQGGLSRIRRGVQGGSLQLATGVATLKGVSVVALLGIGGEAALPLEERDGFAAAIEKARAAVGLPMVTLLGPAGAGKTSLACAMVRALAERGDLDRAPAVSQGRLRLRVLFVTAYELARARAQLALGKGEAPVVADAMDARVLVIDDLGLEPASGLQGAAAEVIHERHAAERVTLVTSGFSAEELATRYGAGIARRLCETRVIRVEARRAAT